MKTTDTKLAKYFRIWLEQWIKKNKFTQLQASIRLDVTPGFINLMINENRAASPMQMEKIANAVNMNILDILILGRKSLEGDKNAETPIHVTDLLTAGLSPEQTKQLQMYRELLLMGGEGVETLSSAIDSLAVKKNASQGVATSGKLA